MMLKSKMRAGALALGIATGVIAVSAADVVIAPTVRNWSQAFFSKEGYHTLTLRGAEMKPIGKDRVDVVDLNIIRWSGESLAKVDTTIISPEATFLIEEKFASGKKAVRIIRDDFEVTGEDWSYDYAQKKISIAKHTHVVFKASMPDFLK
jgi:hypothetical protein